MLSGNQSASCWWNARILQKGSLSVPFLQHLALCLVSWSFMWLEETGEMKEWWHFFSNTLEQRRLRNFPENPGQRDSLDRHFRETQQNEFLSGSFPHEPICAWSQGLGSPWPGNTVSFRRQAFLTRDVVSYTLHFSDSRTSFFKASYLWNWEESCQVSLVLWILLLCLLNLVAN